jgi:hypothetical protein
MLRGWEMLSVFCMAVEQQAPLLAPPEGVSGVCREYCHHLLEAEMEQDDDYIAPEENQ